MHSLSVEGNGETDCLFGDSLVDSVTVRQDPKISLVDKNITMVTLAGGSGGLPPN